MDNRGGKKKKQKVKVVRFGTAHTYDKLCFNMLENWSNVFGKDDFYNYSETEESQNIVLYLKNICISELLGTNMELLQPSTRKHGGVRMFIMVMGKYTLKHHVVHKIYPVLYLSEAPL